MPATHLPLRSARQKHPAETNMIDYYQGLADSIFEQIKDQDASISRDDFFLFLEKKMTGEMDAHDWEPYLNDRVLEKVYETQRLIENISITIKSLSLPDDSSAASERTEKLLRVFPRLRFVDCDFHCSDLFPDIDSSVSFIECRFHNDWIVHNVKSSQDANVLFSECEFIKRIFITGENLWSVGIYGFMAIFQDCQIFDLQILNATLEPAVFLDTVVGVRGIQSLTIRDSEIRSKFSLANLKDNKKITLISSAFKKKFALIACCIEALEITNTNFLGMVDFFESKFASFNIIKTKFRDFSSFENCYFGCRYNSDKVISLKYVAFHGMVNFRGACFYQALDLRNTSRAEVPNFLDAQFQEQAKLQTDRETFRIIKHSFDAVGNHIEANRYYALEMDSYRQELSKGGARLERFLLWFNYISSNYGQNYLLPIIWIVFCVFLLAILDYAKNEGWLYRIYAPLNPVFETMAVCLNEFASYLKFASPVMFEGMEFLSLLISGVIAALIWQMLVAFRRHAKR